MLLMLSMRWTGKKIKWYMAICGKYSIQKLVLIPHAQENLNPELYKLVIDLHIKIYFR